VKKISLGLILLALLNFSNFAQTEKIDGKKPISESASKVVSTTKSKIQNDEPPYVNKVLPNGLEVIVLPDSSVPIVTIELVARNGSFTEPLELNGLSHLYEHMFFKTNKALAVYRCELLSKTGNLQRYAQYGCAEKMKSKAEVGNVDYFNEIDRYGYTQNGTTNEEHVNYFFTTTSAGLPTLMRYMRDAVRFPLFDEDEFQREIQVVIGELERNESNPFYYLDRTLMDKLFYKYPTRKRPGGTRETVLSATTEKMRTIQNRYYVPNNMALIVTGDTEAEKVFRLAEELFGSWERRKTEPFVEFPLVEHPPLPKSEGIIVEQPIQNVIVQIGWHGPSIGKDDASTYAADVFSYIVEQPNSRFSRAMIDSGLAVETNVHYYTQRNVGPIRVTLVTSPEKAKNALSKLYSEISQFTNPDYFTDEELENAKSLIEASNLFDREKLSEYSHILGFWWSSTGIDYYRGYHKNLRAVSRQDINRYIKTYIHDKNHIGVALLSPESQRVAKLTAQDLIGK
jgi:zinc protease